MSNNMKLIRCILRYFISLILLVMANKLMSFCATYYAKPFFVLTVVGIFIMVRSGRKVWRRRRADDETGLYIMHVLNACICWSGALWWALNGIMYAFYEYVLYNHM